MGFRTLYERHAGWLAIRLIRRSNDRDLVADAIQDAFVAVWQRPQGFRGDGDIAARPTAPANRTSEIDISLAVSPHGASGGDTSVPPPLVGFVSVVTRLP